MIGVTRYRFIVANIYLFDLHRIKGIILIVQKYRSVCKEFIGVSFAKVFGQRKRNKYQS